MVYTAVINAVPSTAIYLAFVDKGCWNELAAAYALRIALRRVELSGCDSCNRSIEFLWVESVTLIRAGAVGLADHTSRDLYRHTELHPPDTRLKECRVRMQSVCLGCRGETPARNP